VLPDRSVPQARKRRDSTVAPEKLRRMNGAPNNRHGVDYLPNKVPERLQ
jgi:hypothetical protein